MEKFENFKKNIKTGLKVGTTAAVLLTTQPKVALGENKQDKEKDKTETVSDTDVKNKVPANTKPVHEDEKGKHSLSYVYEVPEEKTDSVPSLLSELKDFEQKNEDPTKKIGGGKWNGLPFQQNVPTVEKRFTSSGHRNCPGPDKVEVFNLKGKEVKGGVGYKQAARQITKLQRIAKEKGYKNAAEYLSAKQKAKIAKKTQNKATQGKNTKSDFIAKN